MNIKKYHCPRSVELHYGYTRYLPKNPKTSEFWYPLAPKFSNKELNTYYPKKKKKRPKSQEEIKKYENKRTSPKRPVSNNTNSREKDQMCRVGIISKRIQEDFPGLKDINFQFKRDYRSTSKIDQNKTNSH